MKRIIKPALWTILILYTVFALWLLFVRDRADSGLGIIEHFRERNNLIPFSTVIHDIKEIARGNHTALYIRNFFGNTMLIFPFGLFLPYLTDRFKSAWRMLVIFVCIIVAVEILQLLLRVGSVDADDLILNVAGGMAGYGIYRLISGKRLDNNA